MKFLKFNLIPESAAHIVFDKPGGCSWNGHVSSQFEAGIQIDSRACVLSYIVIA